MSLSFLEIYNPSIENRKIDLDKISDSRISYLRHYINSWKLDFSQNGFDQYTNPAGIILILKNQNVVLVK